MIELIKFRQGSISVGKYSLKFTLLSKYLLSIVANSRDRMSKLVLSVFEMVVKECRTDMLINYMFIYHPMVYAQQIEVEKNSREEKKAKTGDGNFSIAKSDGQGHPRL